MGAGGGKTSTGTSSSTSPYAPLLAQFGRSALPLYQQLSSQAGEALRTGGVNAQIPLINRSLDENRAASSTSLESTRQALARSGLGGTGFAQSLLAGETMQAEQSAAQIPTNIASQFIAGAPGLVSPGISALGTAGNLTRDISSSETASLWQMFNQTFAAGGQAGAGAAMAKGAFF